MLQIRLLGQFDVRVDGRRVSITTRAAQSLLAYLALTAGTSQRREKLAGMLWPEISEETARKNLRHELWRIRKAISTQQAGESEYLVADELTLRFNREAEYWLDVAQLERPDLDLQALIANLSLYQGELLPGFYDEWITLERERVQAVFEARMEQLLEQLITAERWIAVQEWGERWLTLSGAREPAYRALMLASGARGDMAKVASLYRRCTDELMEQLGVEPSPETRALYNGLLKGTKVPLRTGVAQPSGTITFLFTDIESSTQLLEKLHEQYVVVLNEHHEILRGAIQKWNGQEVDTQGDAFFVTFTRATDAIQCAAESQRMLTAHTWPQGENVRVRMGLHTGEPLISSTGYVGMDVHRAARIGDAGHGGQILLSQTTRELILHDLPEEMSIRDLGEHRLKDLKHPTPIYQLVVEGLSADFPPIRTKFTSTEPTPGEAPFKGLQFFDVADSELFFGREDLTAKLVHRLQETKFLSVIIGASGSGKSSLVRAGVVPAIWKGNDLFHGIPHAEETAGWKIHIITPTAHPLEALAMELTRDSESVTAATTLVDDLAREPRSLYFFLSRQSQDIPCLTLLVVDQFEELFTLCRDEFECEAFIDNLLMALHPPPLALGEERKGEGNLTLVITLRADFYAYLAQYPELREVVAEHQEYIGPMSSEELRRAIEEPARRGHWEFEPGLVDLILRDVGDEPGALPLLSHALLETWKRRAGHTLTLKGYADAGGVHGAIAHTAESLYQTLLPDEQTITRNILLRLTEFGEGTEDTRRRASFEELMSQSEDSDDVRAVLNRLAQARLVTLSEDLAEVAHEALIREWPRLREWLSEDREGIILHRRLTEAAQEWELLEHDTGSLFRGARLVQTNEWFALNPQALNAQERMFLEASNQQARKEEQEREEQRQRELAVAKELAETQRRSASRLRTRNRVITTVGAVSVILALLAGMFGLRAENEKSLAVSRELAAAAIKNLNVDPERSALLALYGLSQSHTKEAQEALHQSVLSLRTKFRLVGHTDNVNSIAFSPDGKRLATVSTDRTAKIWDAATGKELMTIVGHIAPIYEVAFSPDGKQLATSSDDKTVRIWDAATGKELMALIHPDWAGVIAYAPDGKRLASGGGDGTVRVWDTATGREMLTISGFADYANDIAFSPDGNRLATSGNNIQIWNATTGKELLSIIDDDINHMAFSPDGKQLATGVGSDVKIWDATNGKLQLTLPGNPSAVLKLAFSPDGTRLASGGGDGTVRVLDLATGHELMTLFGNGGPVWRIAFSPDGNLLASASEDKIARVWDVSPSGSRELLTIPGNNFWNLAFSPDEKRIVSSGLEDGTVQVWDSESGKERLTLIGHQVGVWHAVYSPDGKRIATAGVDNTARVWDAVTGKELFTITGGGEHALGNGLIQGVMDVAFSPDGKRLATAQADGVAKVWDASTGKELQNFSGGSAGLTRVLFSPDGKLIVTASDDDINGTVRIWDAITGKQLHVLPGLTVRIWAIAFSPDGKYLATGGWGGVLKVWDVATGMESMDLPGNTSTVGSVAFSADGKWIASAGTGIKIWKSVTGEELLSLPGGDLLVLFNRAGTGLFTIGDDGVHLYALRIEDLIALAKSRVTRSLTAEECQTYLHMEACPSEP